MSIIPYHSGVMLYAIEATMVRVANLVTDKLSSYI
jgi:hypothetical protein